MSAHMKKRLIKKVPKLESSCNKKRFLFVIEGGQMYAIPKKVAKQYMIQFSHHESINERDIVTASELFADIQQRLTKAGALLKGVRARENLTQIEFAKKINVTQANLSKMENGKRPIGKQIAKRVEKVFGVNYRYFLE